MIEIKTPEMILEERVAMLETKINALETYAFRIGEKVHKAEITRAEIGMRICRLEREQKAQELREEEGGTC